MDSVPVITLVGKRQARVGNEFVYMGRTDKCIDCPLRKVCCDKLEPDRVYKVISVREREHDCPIHEGGVQLVEVEESGATMTLPTHQLFEGALLLEGNLDEPTDFVERMTRLMVEATS